MCLLYFINTLNGRKVGGDFSRLSGGHFVEISHVGHVTPAQYQMIIAVLKLSGKDKIVLLQR